MVGSRVLALVFTVLQIVAHSALATDRLQTQHWIAGTRTDPIITVDRVVLYESNPLIAGHPEKLDSFYAAWTTAVQSAPDILPPAAAWGLTAFVAGGCGLTVVRNHQFLETIGLPRYMMLAYNWHW